MPVRDLEYISMHASLASDSVFDMFLIEDSEKNAVYPYAHHFAYLLDIDEINKLDVVKAVDLKMRHIRHKQNGYILNRGLLFSILCYTVKCKLSIENF